MVDVVFDFLGVKTRTSYMNNPEYWAKFRNGAVIPFDYDYYEWQTLLKSVHEAGESYCVVELGAGWGRWSCRAAKAYQKYKGAGAVSIIAVEPDETHCKWIREHYNDNGIKNFVLYNTGVSPRGSYHKFRTADPAKCYGDALLPIYRTGRMLKTVSLNYILSRTGIVDFMDIDIQGLEYKVLYTAMNRLNKQCKRVYVEIHNPADEEHIYRLFKLNEWECEVMFSKGEHITTDVEEYTMIESAQAWVNPKMREQSN